MAESTTPETPAAGVPSPAVPRAGVPLIEAATKARHDTGSAVAIAGHPIHVMLVTFPIALTVATLGGDLLYWLTADLFFARVSLWTSGWGFGLGIVAAASGTAELLLVRGIRLRVAPWDHAVAAMMLLAIIGANWGVRLGNVDGAVLPWGLYLSVLGLLAVALAGWHGGQLVFEKGIGVSKGSLR